MYKSVPNLKVSIPTPVKSEDNQQEEGNFPYTIINGLGQGGYSSVLLVRNNETNGLKAMKVIPKKRVASSRDRSRVKNELQALTDIPPSDFLIQCEGAFESPTSIFLITDYNPGGDLFFHLSKRIHQGHAGFTEPQARVMLAEIAIGLQHMHAHHYIHRDIKVENIMLSESGHVKIVDFGLCRRITSDVEPLSPTGSLAYMTPELLTQHTGGRHTDWWAVGVVAYELMTGRSPWSSSSDSRVIRREIKSTKVALPKFLSFSAAQLIRALMNPDYEQRLGTASSEEVCDAPFFEGIDWDKMRRQETEPAIPLPRSSFMRSDCQQAIQTYLRKNTQVEEWSFGLTRINDNPSFAGHTPAPSSSATPTHGNSVQRQKALSTSSNASNSPRRPHRQQSTSSKISVDDQEGAPNEKRAPRVEAHILVADPVVVTAETTSKKISPPKRRSRLGLGMGRNSSSFGL